MNAIITGGRAGVSQIVADQMCLDRERAAPRKPAAVQWTPIYAAMPREGQTVEWIGRNGETIAGVFHGAERWSRADGGEQRESPAMWRPLG